MVDSVARPAINQKTVLNGNRARQNECSFYIRPLPSQLDWQRLCGIARVNGIRQRHCYILRLVTDWHREAPQEFISQNPVYLDTEARFQGLEVRGGEFVTDAVEPGKRDADIFNELYGNSTRSCALTRACSAGLETQF